MPARDINTSAASAETQPIHQCCDIIVNHRGRGEAVGDEASRIYAVKHERSGARGMTVHITNHITSETKE